MVIPKLLWSVFPDPEPACCGECPVPTAGGGAAEREAGASEAAEVGSRPRGDEGGCGTS